MGIQNILFIILLAVGIGFFSVTIKKIIRNIRLGKPLDRNDNFNARLKTMLMVAMGQSKMGTRPIAAFLHILVYVGFVLINMEVLEIIIDGIVGTHRVFSLFGAPYKFAIGFFEILAVLVLLACVIFLIRRNVLKVGRFQHREITGWPKFDANIILITEVVLMSALLLMNAADALLINMGSEHYAHLDMQTSDFLVSQFITPFLPSSEGALIFIERGAWWFHIIGILAFLNFLPFSKHFHIILAFPNTYYSNLNPKGKFTNLEAVTKEVKLMMDPSADPYAAPADPNAAPSRFGAKDIQDLTWKQLLDAYTCTECGRCTSECPANQTGKLLSPRAIMMATRDRMEEVGKNIDAKGIDFKDEKSLIHNYITPEEVWACTSCNACVQACPINIDPLSIIIDLRRYLVMEESAAPTELNTMSTNIENNGAPWQFSPSDRLKWAEEQ